MDAEMTKKTIAEKNERMRKNFDVQREAKGKFIRRFDLQTNGIVFEFSFSHGR